MAVNVKLDTEFPAVLVAVVVVLATLLAFKLLAWLRGGNKEEHANLRNQLRSARAEIRELLDSVNCGEPLRNVEMNTE